MKININNYRDIILNTNYIPSSRAISQYFVNDDSDEIDPLYEKVLQFSFTHEHTHYIQNYSTSFGILIEILRYTCINAFHTDLKNYLDLNTSVIRNLANVENPLFRHFKNTRRFSRNGFVIHEILKGGNISKKQFLNTSERDRIKFAYNDQYYYYSMGFEMPFENQAYIIQNAYLKKVSNPTLEHIINQLIPSDAPYVLSYTSMESYLTRNLDIENNDQILKLLDWTMLVSIDFENLESDIFNRIIPVKYVNPLLKLSALVESFKEKNNGKIPDDLDDFLLKFDNYSSLSAKTIVEETMNYFQNNENTITGPGFREKLLDAFNLRKKDASIIYNPLSKKTDQLFKDDIYQFIGKPNLIHLPDRFLEFNSSNDRFYFHINDLFDCLYFGYKKKCPFWSDCPEKLQVCETDYFSCNSKSCLMSKMLKRVFKIDLSQIHELN